MPKLIFAHLFTYFYPRPPRGGRLEPIVKLVYIRHFYPRPPRGGRPSVATVSAAAIAISIHALREEGDRADGFHAVNVDVISIHALREEGDGVARDVACAVGDFYPRPPRGGRQNNANKSSRPLEISIHALREEGDTGTDRTPQPWEISIHALREEGDILT